MISDWREFLHVIYSDTLLLNLEKKICLMLYRLFLKYVIIYVPIQYKNTATCRDVRPAHVCTHSPSIGPVHVHCLSLELFPLMMTTGRTMIFQSHVEQSQKVGCSHSYLLYTSDVTETRLKDEVETPLRSFILSAWRRSLISTDWGWPQDYCTATLPPLNGSASPERGE